MLSKKLTRERGTGSFFNSFPQFFKTQRRKDAETQRNPKNNAFLSSSLNTLFKKLTTELTESTEKGKRSMRLLSASILQFIETQRCKDAKNGFQKVSPLLCALCGLFAFTCPLQADPWGKDADLARCRPAQPSCTESQSGPGVAFSELFIRFHQEVISPADGPRSHFIPSSSQYTLDSIRRYGFFKGWMRGCDRLMRENDDPWVYKKCLSPAGQIIKYDPIK